MDDDKSLQFYLAAAEGDLVVVEELAADSEVDLNWQDVDFHRSPFYKACEGNRVAVVRFLLGLDGVDLNLTNKGRVSPLKAACREGHVDVVALMLADDRIQVNKMDRDRTTPFFSACEEGHVGVVKLLLADDRVDVNKARDDDTSPFYAACQNNRVEVVELLLADRRVNVNKPREDGSTPIWMATDEGHLHVVQHLLACGRPISLRKMAFNKRTPAQQAKFLAVDVNSGHNNTADEEDKRRKANFRRIASTFDAFEKNPDTTRWHLVRELRLDGPKSGELFSLVVYLTDGYLSILPYQFNRKTQWSQDDKIWGAKRFFKMAARLPLELQMVLCNVAFGSGASVVKRVHSELGFRKFAKEI